MASIPLQSSQVCVRSFILCPCGQNIRLEPVQRHRVYVMHQLELLPFVQKFCGCRSAIVMTIVYTNCNGSGSAAYPGDNTKTILAAFLAKRCRVATCTSAMAERSVIIASLMTSLLGTDPCVSRASGSRVCR